MAVSPDAFRLASDAIEALRQSGLEPSERNYAVMRGVLQASPPDLAAAFHGIRSQNLPLTQERMAHLYMTYLSGDQDRQVAESALRARQLVADMLLSVQECTGSAGAIGQQVASDLSGLPSAPTEDDLRVLASQVIRGASRLRESGDNLQSKLEESQKEITALREDLARVTVESETDSLTRIFNRKAFDARLRMQMQDAAVEKSDLTLLVLDVDHFKQFNDRFGHLIGDEVLKTVARTLIDTVKGMDTVARFGGEEFAVILPKTPLKGGMIVADAIRRSIASRALKRKDTGENFGTITVSIGVSGLRAGSDTAESLIERADAALYRAKRSGRNQVQPEDAAA